MTNPFSIARDALARGSWNVEKGLSKIADSALPFSSEIRRDWLDSIAAVVSNSSHGSDGLFREAMRTLDGVSDLGVRAMSTWIDGYSCTELKNRLNVFRLFEDAPDLVGLTPYRSFELPDAVELAYEKFSPFKSVWIVEGLGYAFTKRNWHRRRGEKCRLLEDLCHVLPEKSLIPLHVGMGLSLAERHVANGDDSRNVSTRVREFLTLCAQCSVPHYEKAAIEPLGLVVKNLAPRLISSVNSALDLEDQVCRALFWHGVGRGLYFNPLHAVPFTNGNLRHLETIESISPNKSAFTNVIAGSTWARLLVNLRSPEVFCRYMDQFDERLGFDEAFSHGVASAAVIWYDCAPEDASLRSFLNHLSDSRTRSAMKWQSLVRDPARYALSNIFSVLKQTQQLAGVFAVENLRH